MRDGRRLINFRISDDEAKLLATFAKKTLQTQTDVLRRLIRSLRPRMAQAARDARDGK
jgi:hypothetical protein